MAKTTVAAAVTQTQTRRDTSGRAFFSLTVEPFSPKLTDYVQVSAWQSVTARGRLWDMRPVPRKLAGGQKQRSQEHSIPAGAGRGRGGPVEMRGAARARGDGERVRVRETERERGRATVRKRALHTQPWREEVSVAHRLNGGGLRHTLPCYHLPSGLDHIAEFRSPISWLADADLPLPDEKSLKLQD